MSTPVHYKTPNRSAAPTIACGAHPLRISYYSEDPGRVTCFACRKTAIFKGDQLLGVGAPTPPIKLSGVMTEAPGLTRLMGDVLKSCRNERGMYVIEETIHHGEYRSTRRVEVHAINAVTVDAVIQSSAYAYGSWLHPDNPEHKQVRNTQLHQLVADLKALRTNRCIGWSTFRIITDH
jgi:hypothetical protein